MTGQRAIFDASLLVRAVVDGPSVATEWIRRAETGAIDAAAPELIWAEVTHALLRYVRGGFMSVEAAQERLVWLLGVPIVLESPAAFAPAALSRAVDYGLSTYDAFYLVLAEAADATLVTVDRRLAERAPRAELVD